MLSCVMLFACANILIFNEIDKGYSLFRIGISMYFINVAKGCGLASGMRCEYVAAKIPNFL